MSKFIILVSLFFVVVFFPNPSFAQNKSLFPAVSEGPGHILPDSPFYVADKIFQKAKLLVVLSPEKRAIVRNQIVGERIAELRVMHAKGSQKGMSLALLEISNESNKISEDLKEAQLSGKDVSKTAKYINDSLSANRDVIAIASQNSDEKLSLQLESANIGLLASKVNVETYLNDKDLDDAIDEDLELETETAVLGASTEAEKADKKLEKMEKRTEKDLENEDKKLGQEKSEAKKAAAAELIQKRKKMIEERKKKIQEAREALKKTKEASKKIKEARRSKDELRKISPVPTIIPAQ